MSHEWRGGADGRCVFEVLDHRSGYRGPCALSADHPIHQVPIGNDETLAERFDSDDRSGAGDGGWSTRIVPAEAVLPYAGTSGWSGSETSRSTVVDQDNDGRTLDKQQQALRAFDTHNTYGRGEDAHYIGRSYGLTWRELDTLTSWGHGSTSRVLSDLHKAGLLARLSEVRNRCKVYVLPEYVGGRETEPHGGRGGDRLTPGARARVRAAAEEAEANIWGLDVSDLVTDLVNIIDQLAPEPKVAQATDEGRGAPDFGGDPVTEVDVEEAPPNIEW